MTVHLKFITLLLSMVLILPISATAQVEDEAEWAQGLSSYEHFMVYPHLERGFRAMEDNKTDVAIAEFLQAHKFAKNQPQIALYLVNAYDKNKQFDQAIDILKSLMLEYPNRQDIQQMLTQVKTELARSILQQAQARSSDVKQLQQYLAKNRPDFTQAYDEYGWLKLLSSASSNSNKLLSAYAPKFKQNEIFQIEEIIKNLIASGNQKQTSQYIDRLSQTIKLKPHELDHFSYQLLEQGAPNQAMELLLKAYPFLSTDENLRQILIERLALAQSVATDKNILITFIQNRKINLENPEQEKEWLELISIASPYQEKLLSNYQCKFEENRSLQAKLMLNQFESGTSNKGNISAAQLTRFLPYIKELHPAQLDQISYKLDKEGLPAQSLKLLLDEYPFDHTDPEVKSILFDRLANLIAGNSKNLTQHEIAQLSKPLGSAIYRGKQSKLLEALDNCKGVEQVLEDYSVSYLSEDWLRLGNCYQKEQKSGLAQFAYTQAYKRDHSPHSARVLAYQAFDTKDYQTALQMWKVVLASEQFNTKDQMAAAYTAVSFHQLTLASKWVAEYAANGGRKSDEYWWLKTITEQKNNPEQAIIDVRRAIDLKPQVEYYEVLAALETKLGNESAAILALEKAQALNPDNSSVKASLGYAYYQQNELVKADKYLDQARLMRPDDNGLVEQLAYVNQRLGQNEKAVFFTERAIDHDNLYTKAELTPEIERERFGLRRMHEDLTRKWSFSADAISGNQVAAVPNSPQPGLNYKSYAQAEIAYRLGNPAIDDGKTISAYSRVFAGNGPSGSSLPIYAPVLAAGLRWKPFSSQVINFSAEQQVALDQGQSPSSNTLLRISASFLNSGKYSDEWHPATHGWLAQNLYLDAAYYIVNQLSSLTADYRLSYHNKIGENQTVEPYSHIQWNSLNQQTQADIRAGFGVRWNIWGNETNYNAYASKITVGLEFQYAISTYLSDKSTALLTLGGRW